MGQIKYFLQIKNTLDINIEFDTLIEVYDYITKEKLVAGTYKLYKAERIINEDV